MRIVGIDPGLNITGYGLIEVDAEGEIALIEAGVIKSSYKYPLQNRLCHIYDEISKLISEYKPHSIVLEKTFSHYKYPATVISISYARGLICLLSGQKDIALYEYSATRIKKALTGNGHASKEQVQRMVFNLLKVGNFHCYLDATDALALAIGHYRLEGAASFTKFNSSIVNG